MDARRLVSKLVGGALPSSGLVTVALIAGVVSVEATPVLDVEQSGASAWLGLGRSGVAALYDGTLAEQPALALLDVAEPGADLDITQLGAGALVLDRDSGAVTKLDGASRVASATITPGPAGDAELVVEGDTVWFVAGSEAVRLDPVSLGPVSSRIELPAERAPDLAVDGDGRLWYASGGALRVAGDPTVSVELGGEGELGSAATWPLALDQGILRFLPDGSACQVAVEPGAEVLDSPSAAVVADPAGGVIHLVDEGCGTRTFQGLDPSARLGPVVAAGRWLLAADQAAGRVVVIDGDAPDGTAVTWIDVPGSDPGLPLRLHPAGDVVFYNQPAIDLVGVIEPGSGTAVPLAGAEQGSGWACAVSDTLLRVGGQGTVSAVDTASGSLLDDAVWHLDDGSGVRQVGSGATLAVAADAAAELRYSFTSDDQPAVACDPIQVTEALTAGIIRDHAGPVNPGDTLTFRSASSNDGDTYHWTLQGADAVVHRADDGPAVTVGFPTIGSATLTLRITNGDEQADATELITITPPPNDQPPEPDDSPPPTISGLPPVIVPPTPDEPTPENPSGTTTTTSTTPTGDTSTTAATTTTTTTPPAPPSTAPRVPVQITSAEVTSVRVGGLTFTITTNEACNTIDYFLVETATGATAATSTGLNTCNGPIHTLTFNDLAHGAEYTLRATILGTPADGTRPTGTGSATAPPLSAVTFFPAAPPPPPPSEQVVWQSDDWSATATSITLTVVTNNICGGLHYELTDPNLGGVVASGASPDTCGTTRSATISNLTPGQLYNIGFWVVGGPSDGVTPGGTGQSQRMGYLVVTQP